MRTFEWTASLSFPSLALLWGVLLVGSCQTLTCHTLGCSGCLLSFTHWLIHSLTRSHVPGTAWHVWWWCLVTQLFPTLCDHMDCSPLGSSVYGISQVRILAWAAISFSNVFGDGAINQRQSRSVCLESSTQTSSPCSFPLSLRSPRGLWDFTEMFSCLFCFQTFTGSPWSLTNNWGH